MNVTINGEAAELASPISVAELVEARYSAQKGIAVAIDRAVVPRSTWATRLITEGSAVEILVAVQGG